MKRDDALQIVREWVANEALVRHMLAVEAAMRFYARKFGQDVDLWGVAGLLHDADWEKYPQEHPQKLLSHLKERDVHPHIIQAINAHGGKDATVPSTLMDKALFACDEISGFVVAVARMRPGKLEDLEASSVQKKLRDKSFASNVSRPDITKGAELLNIEMTEHVSNIITALRPIAGELGLSPTPVPQL